MFAQHDDSLLFKNDSETVRIEPWGPNAFRVRATYEPELPCNDWALLEKPNGHRAQISTADEKGTIQHGSIKATISKRGKIVIFNKDKLILEEYARHRLDVTDPNTSSLNIHQREFKPHLGGDYHLTARFESLDPEERIYGMGMYQQPYLNIKGCDLELAQRNSQATVPFAVSSIGYGLLWNNPAIGRASFGKNLTTFEAYSTKVLDYWIVAGDTPQDIVRAYTNATGRVPMMPEYGLGFWQCKLRYQTQDELLSVAREYRRRKLPIDLIVIDFFHWPKQGEWKFDPDYWPDPDAMMQELKSLNIELMVSIWPTVDYKSSNFDEMQQKGLLIRQDRGIRMSMTFQGNTVHFDATNPAARQYIWAKAKKNYYSKGIRVFWLDEAEPEYDVYSFDIYRYHLGTNLSIGNIYPREYTRAFHEGMSSSGQTQIVNLARCAWAGSQKYGALIWSGDIASSWSSFRNQLTAGLNMGLAGIAWFTTDIGGFHGGNPNDAAFRELFIRWFQFGTYCPVMRLHGDREPKQPPIGDTGGGPCASGAANEVWSYGDEVLAICTKYLHRREEMRAYTRSLMKAAHEHGDPIMRPCFYDFPHDQMCWQKEDQYMYGPKYLCAPVLEAGQTRREVYLPGGARWRCVDGASEASDEGDGVIRDGGRSITVPCPLDTMPVFTKV